MGTISAPMATFWVTAIFTAAVILVFYLKHKSDGQHSRWVMMWEQLYDLLDIIMSRYFTVQVAHDAGTDGGSNQEIPDTNAIRTGTVDQVVRTDTDTVRLSDHLTEGELLALLAVQKKGDGYRFSKNQLCEFLGGTRGKMLVDIESLRMGTPEAEKYPNRTPEQEATRKELGLP